MRQALALRAQARQRLIIKVMPGSMSLAEPAKKFLRQHPQRVMGNSKNSRTRSLSKQLYGYGSADVHISSHTHSQPVGTALPLRAGVGLKTMHFMHILETLPDVGFFEIHAENYMVEGGPFHHYLERIRNHYPLSIHGVALSIGSKDPLNTSHLDALRRLLDRYQPESFSEHLAWSSHGDGFLNDLLPLPYTTKTLQRVCDHIDQTQHHLNRRMLLENPATYVEFVNSSMDEAAFISEVIRRTGCGLLLDVNNAYVSCINHGRDPQAYIHALPLEHLGEIHLAGFDTQADTTGAPLLIDHHGAPVAHAVWDLYDFALKLTGPAATLIERDNNVPTFNLLAAEAWIADVHLSMIRQSKDNLLPLIGLAS